MKPATRETLRIVGSMTAVCIIGAAVLGVVHGFTERGRAAAALVEERRAAVEMLGLGADASLLEVRQLLDPRARIVVYRAAPYGAADAPARELRLALDGTVVGHGDAPARAATADAALQPLGRMLVAQRAGHAAGFLVESEANGFKSRIRFFVALSESLTILGVRVIEHGEDPGLGAEIASPVFDGQFVGRAAREASSLAVTRDPMPEDWHAALLAAALRQPDAQERRNALLARERMRPIYAVTGATISSRALTEGVRATIEHFRHRWELLQPWLGAAT